jgi:threonine/homoserine/homoserine lactone efflux protein
MSAAVLWCFVLSALVTWGRQFVTPRFFRWVSLGCGVALGYFGSRLLWMALTSVSVLP